MSEKGSRSYLAIAAAIVAAAVLISASLFFAVGGAARTTTTTTTVTNPCSTASSLGPDLLFAFQVGVTLPRDYSEGALTTTMPRPARVTRRMKSTATMATDPAKD